MQLTKWYGINYECYKCGCEWYEEYDCACDSQCPECDAKNVTAKNYEEIEE